MGPAWIPRFAILVQPATYFATIATEHSRTSPPRLASHAPDGARVVVSEITTTMASMTSSYRTSGATCFITTTGTAHSLMSRKKLELPDPRNAGARDAVSWTTTATADSIFLSLTM